MAARVRMNWDWIRGVRVTVFSQFVKYGVFHVRIMLGESHAPTDAPKWTGTVTSNKPTLSHLEAFDAAARYVDKKLAAAGLALTEHDTVLGGYS